MAQQLFYVDDTVRLKTDHSRIGIVERSFANVETHTPDLLQYAIDGHIEQGSGVDPFEFNEFVQSGAPPRGAVYVVWTFPENTDRTIRNYTLITETELDLLDRALIFGDVVRRSAQDAMSGTIIGATTTVSLLQPLSTSPTRPPSADNVPQHSIGHSLPSPGDRSNMLTNISVDDLTWPNDIERGHIVVYKGWIGVVDDIEEDIYVRLSNNSVVIPEDCSILRTTDDTACQINDTIKCRKSSLRRGRWIYGTYDADISPDGIIVDIRPRGIVVEWLVCNRPYFGQITPEQPDDYLEEQVFVDPLFHIYDRRTTPDPAMQRCNNPDQVPTGSNLEVTVGDRVRFKNLEQAIFKYGNHGSPLNGATNELIRVPRDQTLGFDLNVFIVAETKTHVDVLWQDGTTSKGVPANDLYPYPDVDNDEEVWPGELVVSRENKSDNPEWCRPARSGIVQRVNAQDRLAYIKWFRKGNVNFSRERPSYLLPDTRTSALSDEICEVSLYDVLSIQDFSRRLGDLVVIGPSDFTERLLQSNPDNFPGQEGVRFALKEGQQQRSDRNSFESSSIAISGESPHLEDAESVAWLGEIIELGLDGLLTIRLGAHDPPLDIRVPWECTVIAYTDEEDDEDEDYGYEVSDTDEIFSDEESVDSAQEDDTRGWHDEAGNEVVTNGGEWLTEDEEWDDDGETSSSSNGGSEDDDGDVEMTDAPPEPLIDDSDENARMMAKPPNDIAATDPKLLHMETQAKPFDYSLMFKMDNDKNMSAGYGIEAAQPLSFAVLDGSVPEDHHFANQPSLTGAKELRRIQKEYQMLRTSLPPGAYVRTWESRMNLMRLLLLGPIDTPYEYAPFLFDFYMDSSFPNNPPQVYFHSWTNDDGACNPNLYEDGKVCLSLLGTWAGDDPSQTWNAGKSSILQIIVSFLGLVLVKEPYYNEAGFETRVGSAESQIPSALYSERSYFQTRGFIAHVLNKPVSGFENLIQQIYLRNANGQGADLLQRAISTGIDVIHRSKKGSRIDSSEATQRRVSAGAVVPLSRQLDGLLAILTAHNREEAELLRHRLKQLRP